MPIVTLRPASTEGGVFWTVVPGGSSAHGVLADDADGTYLESTGTAGVGLGLSLFTMPDRARIVGVRRRIREQHVSGTATRHAVELLYGSGSRILPRWSTRPDQAVGAGVIREAAEAWQSGPAFGETLWTPALLNDAVVDLARELSGTSRVHELFLDVDYNEAPTVTVVTPGPGEVVDTTTRPKVTLDYHDPDGDPQASWHVRLYDGDVGSGFESVAHLDHIANSGSTPGAANEWTPPDLDNGNTYTVLARVTQEYDGPGAGTHGSLWTGHTFTLDLATPDAPSVTVVPQPGQGRHAVEVADPGGTIAADRFGVEYRDGPDQPWRWVRGAEGLDATSGPVVVYDHEAPFAAPRTYRVRSHATVGAEPVASPATIVDGTLDVPPGTVWLVDVFDPSRLSGPVRIDPDRTRTFVGRDVAHPSADLSTSVVESELPTRRDEVTFLAGDPAEHDLLVAAFASVRTLLLRDDRREHVYVRVVGDRSRQQVGDRAFGVDAFPATLVEVARPRS